MPRALDYGHRRPINALHRDRLVDHHAVGHRPIDRAPARGINPVADPHGVVGNRCVNCGLDGQLGRLPIRSRRGIVAVRGDKPLRRVRRPRRPAHHKDQPRPAPRLALLEQPAHEEKNAKDLFYKQAHPLEIGRWLLDIDSPSSAAPNYARRRPPGPLDPPSRPTPRLGQKPGRLSHFRPEKPRFSRFQAQNRHFRALRSPLHFDIRHSAFDLHYWFSSFQSGREVCPNPPCPDSHPIPQPKQENRKHQENTMKALSPPVFMQISCFPAKNPFLPPHLRPFASICGSNLHFQAI